MTVALVNKALMIGLSQCRISAGLLLHSDQGSQYAAKDYQALLSEHGICCSMSGTGNFTITRWPRVFFTH